MKKVKNHLYLLFILLTVFSLILSGCGKSESSQSSGSEIRVAFIYKEKIVDYNWSYIHEVGRQYLVEQLPDIEIKYVEEVAVDQVEKVLRDLAGEGYKLIFATAPEFSAAVLAVAKEFPDTFFEVCQGTETAANVATYDGRMYQAFYVAGGYVGELTVKDMIGFVAPEPSVEVIRNINAMALSTLLVRSFEGLTIDVKWTGSWNDPAADRAAAIELIEEGADVLIQHTYSSEVQKVAEEYGVRSFGYGFDMREFAPTKNATSIVYDWGWYYLNRVNAVADGTWKGEAYLGKVSAKNFGAGIIDLAPYTYVQIPQIMEAPPMKWRTRFVETNKDVFEGPIKDQAGNVVLAKGESFDDAYIYNEMDWFVFGVVGESPGEPPVK